MFSSFETHDADQGLGNFLGVVTYCDLLVMLRKITARGLGTYSASTNRDMLAALRATAVMSEALMGLAPRIRFGHTQFARCMRPRQRPRQ
jgi:Ni,Fe-hydrogenase I cytochrome b subunit